MLTPNLFILYVSDPLESAKFYEQIIGEPPVGFPTYQAFEFDNGLIFGLWSTSAKNFVSGGEGHRSELAFQVENEEIVRNLYAQWREIGVEIEQELEEAVSGLTFVALDPDGHRIRVNLPDG
ncbi:Glyoxalase-like domain protein [Pseudovibrio axinellae]|uniref:Glyoxalase-like domain protein n=1 Tax=Pseudovibrio axinellae TaxID=989403 RepID=A0A165Z615_9HYPH|nr:VOC family protein [Pseudovibrio axinellae]KZL19541.1 Glyoxalase-like domain protein [Pseudovibrio axinellae]SEQ31160.1 Glyoxalase/Bleomycin resistance protein/Dioxygenase superfamily protein [Pseudovibrio axinellae]